MSFKEVIDDLDADLIEDPKNPGKMIKNINRDELLDYYQVFIKLYDKLIKDNTEVLEKDSIENKLKSIRTNLFALTNINEKTEIGF